MFFLTLIYYYVLYMLYLLGGVDMLNNNIPILDLHGESRDIARVLIKNFIRDNYKLRIPKVMIVHGIGTGILKKETHDFLKKSKLVSKYYIDMFNVGTTIVELHYNIDKNP